MAKKLAIDLDPKGPLHFTRSVKIPTGDGKPLTVEFDFLFRDFLEMAALQERWNAVSDEMTAKAKAEKAENEAMDAAIAAGEIVPVRVAKNAVEEAKEELNIRTDWLLDFLVGWQLSQDFNRENLFKFLVKYPRSFFVLMADYREGMTQGRLGN